MRTAFQLAWILASCDLRESAPGDEQDGPSAVAACTPHAWYADADGDGLAGGPPVDYACDPQPGWSATPDDCDDRDPGLPTTLYRDDDRDGFGIPDELRTGCIERGWSRAVGDCDDGDATVYPGAPERCGDDRINDCAAASPAQCRYWGNVDIAETGILLAGSHPDGGAGISVAVLDDVDGDSLDEVVIGAPRVGGASEVTGAAYVVRTVQGGGTLEGAATLIVEGSRWYEMVGAFSGAGADVTGDAVPDVLVSGWGEVIVVDGAASGHQTAAGGAIAHLRIAHSAVAIDVIDSDGTADIAFEDFTPTSDGRTCIVDGPVSGEITCDLARTILTSPAYTYTSAGRSLFAVGDTDADGRDDIVVAGAADTQSRVAGSVWLLTDIPAGEHLLDDVATGHLFGTQYEEHLGWTLDGAGDVNGDGYADLLLGSWAGDEPYLDAKQEIAARIVLGPVAGDHPVDDVAVATIRDVDLAGPGEVAGAGDLDGDGFAEVLIARPSAPRSGSGAMAGAVNLFYGPVEGDLQISILEPELSDADAIFWGEPGDVAGVALDGDGDFDGDGFADFVVGAESHGADLAGGVYVLFGQTL